MIHQAELREIEQRRARVKELEQLPEVREYLGAKALEGKALEVLRSRLKAGEEVKPGRLSVLIKRAFAVEWQKVLSAYRAATQPTPAALAILQDAIDKNPAADFVTERLSVDVVASK